VLGIDVTVPEDNDFDRAFQRAFRTGAREAGLTLNWADLETAPGVFHPDPNWLQIANLFYPPQGERVSLILKPIDVNQLRMPPDLAGKAFDDPVVIQRFDGLLDWVFTQIPDLDLTCLSIGNEVDIFLGTDPVLWSQYRNFFQAVSAHARTLRAGMPVGVKATFGGWTGTSQAQLQALNASSDVILVTYYPLFPDFTVRPPKVVSSDFDALLAAVPPRPVFFLEAGYPSSAVCNSSEEKQARFVAQAFRAWDAHRSRIKILSFTWLHDLSQADADAFASEFGIQDPIFIEYLRTLGLRTWPAGGQPKKAFRQLRLEAGLRGW